MAAAAAPPSSPPLAPDDEEEITAVGLAIGLLLTLMGAAALALSMIVQRYALSYPSDSVPFGCVRLRRNVAWFVGLLFYIAANILKVIALNYGPLTVFGSVFTTLLIFNLVFARWLLREVITPPKVVGAVLIVLGGGVVCGGTPGLTGGTSPPTTFSSKEVADLILSPPPGGVFLVALLLFAVIASIFIIEMNEKRYPAQTLLDENVAMNADNRVERVLRTSAVAARMSVARMPLDLTESAIAARASTVSKNEQFTDARKPGNDVELGTSGDEGPAKARRYKFDEGARVWHQTHGVGTVAELMADGRTRVTFDSGQEHRYRPSSMGKLYALSKFSVGARVWHQTHGAGTVAELMEDGRTRVTFDNGQEHRYRPSSTAKLLPLRRTLARSSDVGGVQGSVILYNSKTPSPKLAALMLIVYPGSLGLDETIADLATRAYASILTSCGDEKTPIFECISTSSSWTFYVALAVGITAGLASATYWMRIVYKRYETTVALPIEYGALNVGNLLSGLLFYDESSYMEGWQIGLALGGCFIILLGIGVGQMSFGASAKVEPKA